MTLKALEALGDTLNSVEIWLKLLDHSREVRCEMYNNAMEEIFKQIPITMTKALTSKRKFRKLVTEIGGGWYMEKC